MDFKRIYIKIYFVNTKTIYRGDFKRLEFISFELKPKRVNLQFLTLNMD
jgi:hypothetical protein